MVDGCFEWHHLALSHRNKFNSIAWLFRDGSIRKYQFFTLHNSILLLHHHELNSIDDQLLHVRIMKFPIKVNWDYWPINFNRWLKSIDVCATRLGVSGIALGHMHLLRYFVQLFHFHYITLHYIVRHCGLVVSAPAWDGTGCEFNSWQCWIYIPCSSSLRLLGYLRVSGTYGLTQKLC